MQCCDVNLNFLETYLVAKYFESVKNPIRIIALDNTTHYSAFQRIFGVWYQDCSAKRITLDDDLLALPAKGWLIFSEASPVDARVLIKPIMASFIVLYFFVYGPGTCSKKACVSCSLNAFIKLENPYFAKK